MNKVLCFYFYSTAEQMKLFIFIFFTEQKLVEYENKVYFYYPQDFLQHKKINTQYNKKIVFIKKKKQT